MNIAQLITVLFQSYEKQDQTERQDIYIAMLKDIPVELLSKAVKKCIQEKKFLPTIAEILEVCESLKETITGKKAYLDWDDAWNEIYKGWCNGSPYKNKPKWSTPEIEHVVESFGWLSLLSAPESQTQTIRAQMKAMYEVACKRAKENRANESVLGISGMPQEQISTKLSGLISQISKKKGMGK